MQPTSPLHERIIARFQQLHFEPADDFYWSPESLTIYYDPADPLLVPRLLHEISHAELHHKKYDRDIELIQMERDAWEYAKTTLASEFDVEIEASTIEDDLDTYREWLHARSTCPKCGGNGLQLATLEYKCPTCRTTWTSNQAFGCALRRYTKKRP